ncbi:tRNA uridine-5-carboxymethylaminomethyl(34) synthesis GTPase MnmE, partial [bacterium]|nr:tRNA uridine-5-carboxymethylaminomethyl(34) synthesis GTPase MnmE [bacterium]
AQAKSPYLLNQRQFNLLSEIEIELEGIAKSFVGGVHYELLAYRVKDLIERVSALTGKNVTEHMLDKVFSEFCVGK